MKSEIDDELEKDGFEVCEILNSRGKFHGGRYLLIVVKRVEPIVYSQMTGHVHHMGIMPFETIANAQTIASKYRGRDDILMISIQSIENFAIAASGSGN